MKYDNEIFDCCMQLMRFAHKQLLENERPIMASEIGKWINESETQFIHNAPVFGQLVTLIMGEYAITRAAHFRDLNEDEKEAAMAAIEGRGPRATSTEAAFKAVKEAHKRLKKAERMRPVTEAKEKLDAACEAVAAKEKALKALQDERDRPGKELAEAEKIVEDAESEVRKAESECR